MTAKTICILSVALLIISITGCHPISKIEITPATGDTLTDISGEPSGVILETVRIKKATSDRKYTTVWLDPPTEINAGDTIIEITGTVLNNNPQADQKYIAMTATGYDKTGKKVAETLDAAHIATQILLFLEKGETGDFTLHLNYTKDIDHIRIYGSTYNIMPP